MLHVNCDEVHRRNIRVSREARSFARIRGANSHLCRAKEASEASEFAPPRKRVTFVFQRTASRLCKALEHPHYCAARPFTATTPSIDTSRRQRTKLLSTRIFWAFLVCCRRRASMEVVTAMIMVSQIAFTSKTRRVVESTSVQF